MIQFHQSLREEAVSLGSKYTSRRGIIYLSLVHTCCYSTSWMSAIILNQRVFQCPPTVKYLGYTRIRGVLIDNSLRNLPCQKNRWSLSWELNFNASVEKQVCLTQHLTLLGKVEQSFSCPCWNQDNRILSSRERKTFPYSGRFPTWPLVTQE